MADIIEVNNLTKRFGEHIILDNLNFRIERSSIFGLIGKSGCGKTTLLNMLIGYTKPNKGFINYHGKNVEKIGTALGRIVGFASQEGSFYKKLTVAENLRYFGRLYGYPKNTINGRIKILLETFGLQDAEHTLGQNLSIGMQKRLDIACALIHDPDILILDEPTANLDPALRKNILELIKKINESGTTIIISSHILDDINTLCDKVLVIDNKRIVGFGTPRELEMQLSKNDVIKIESELKNYDILVGSLLSKNLIDNYEVEGDVLCLHTKNTKNTLKHVTNYFGRGGDSLVNIEITKPSLGGIFEDNESS